MNFVKPTEPIDLDAEITNTRTEGNKNVASLRTGQSSDISESTETTRDSMTLIAVSKVSRHFFETSGESFMESARSSFSLEGSGQKTKDSKTKTKVETKSKTSLNVRQEQMIAKRKYDSIYPEYHDYSCTPLEWFDDQKEQEPKNDISSITKLKPSASATRPLRSNTFPVIVHQMLKLVDEFPDQYYVDGIGTMVPSKILRWEHHGRSFVILDRQKLVDYFFPMFFPFQTEYPSFQRQLNLYGFKRLVSKKHWEDETSSTSLMYYHEMMLRTRPDLCSRICRCYKKQKPDTLKGRRPTIDPSSEPSFDLFPPLTYETSQGLQASPKMTQPNKLTEDSVTPDDPIQKNSSSSSSIASSTHWILNHSKSLIECVGPTDQRQENVNSLALSRQLSQQQENTLKHWELESESQHSFYTIDREMQNELAPPNRKGSNEDMFQSVEDERVHSDVFGRRHMLSPDFRTSKRHKGSPEHEWYDRSLFTNATISANKKTNYDMAFHLSSTQTNTDFNARSLSQTEYAQEIRFLCPETLSAIRDMEPSSLHSDESDLFSFLQDVDL